MRDKIYIPEGINNIEYNYYIDQEGNIIIETEENTCINYIPKYNIYTESYTCDTSNNTEISYDQITNIDVMEQIMTFGIACLAVLMFTSLIKGILGG